MLFVLTNAPSKEEEMKLYKITTLFLGKDLNEATILEYAVAENDNGIYAYINKKHKEKKWPGSVNMTRKEIIAAKGDFESEYLGEFYDQKYGWEDLGQISPEDIANLKRLKIINEN